MWDEIIFNRENMSYDDSNRIHRDGDEDDYRYEEYLNEQREAFFNNEIETE